MKGADAMNAPEGAWQIPYEMTLVSTSSSVRRVVSGRLARGERPQPLATVYARGDRLFAIIDFYGDLHPGLFFSLDVWLDTR